MLFRSVQALAASRNTDRHALSRTLRGDLDWIVMKCLQKERDRRYQTAQELAQDIERYINQEPVLAGPPSTYYRLTKFCARRRGLLIATTLVLAVLSLGIVASTALLYRARQREHDVARLADVQLLKDLLGEYEVLASIDYASRRAAMEKWLEGMRGLLARRATYETALTTLRTEGERQANEVSGENGGTGWKFAGPDQQDYHDVLTRFLQQLDAVRQPEGPLSQVESWVVRTPTETEISTAWSTFQQSFSANTARPNIAHYRGLYPLGLSPTSGLWEFVDLTTGLVPDRSADGHLVVAPNTGIVYVLIPAGEFMMGSPEDEPGRKPDETLHSVFLSPFLISKFEITQGQWTRIMNDNPSLGVGLQHPVERVTWEECQQFCQRNQSRLPSEAQWEFACRAGDAAQFSGAPGLGAVGWYKENAGNATHPVGQKAPNRFGLHDMHGNVLEWCADLYSPDFYSQAAAQQVDPLNTGSSSSPVPSSVGRVLRGGSFEGLPRYCRSADRYKDFPSVRHGGVGFRTVRPAAD